MKDHQKEMSMEELHQSLQLSHDKVISKYLLFMLQLLHSI